MADKQVSPEEYDKMVRENCPFCKIADGVIPTRTVYEDSKVIAFLDINPANPGHTLVVPKKHYTVLPQLSDPDTSYLFQVTKRLAGVIFEIMQSSSPDSPIGVNILQNNGAAAGQQVPHVHIHIIPRFEGDGVLPPWEHKKIEDKQMEQLQNAFSTVMKKIPAPSSGPKTVQLPPESQPELTYEKPKEEKKKTTKTRKPRSP